MKTLFTEHSPKLWSETEIDYGGPSKRVETFDIVDLSGILYEELRLTVSFRVIFYNLKFLIAKLMENNKKASWQIETNLRLGIYKSSH